MICAAEMANKEIRYSYATDCNPGRRLVNQR